MSQVNQSTANWRLFGGGGLAVGGLLYALVSLLGKDGDKDVFWLGVIAFAVVGVGFFFVAYGETGGNGAVGDSDTGKLALFITAGLFLLYALLLILLRQGSDIDSSILRLIQIATVVALAWSALEISRKDVAKGLAAVALFGVAAWAAIIQILVWAGEYDWWAAFILGLALLATGVLYVLNN